MKQQQSPLRGSDQSRVEFAAILVIGALYAIAMVISAFTGQTQQTLPIIISGVTSLAALAFRRSPKSTE